MRSWLNVVTHYFCCCCQGRGFSYELTRTVLLPNLMYRECWVAPHIWFVMIFDLPVTAGGGRCRETMAAAPWMTQMTHLTRIFNEVAKLFVDCNLASSSSQVKFYFTIFYNWQYMFPFKWKILYNNVGWWWWGTVNIFWLKK